MSGIWRVLFLLTLLNTAGVAFAQNGSGGKITVLAQFNPDLLPSIEVQFLCNPKVPLPQKIMLEDGEVYDQVFPATTGAGRSCQVLAVPPKGYTASYFIEGDGANTFADDGCQFARVSPGKAHLCRIEVSQDPVKLTVYKQWIGDSGESQDVQISLECESGDYSGFRYINEGAPGGWEITNVDPEGILCNVTETVRDSFRPDIIDCQGLLVLPGKGEECTLINTKIVKRIEMLNRYGIVVMILLVLAVGLLTLRRFS